MNENTQYFIDINTVLYMLDLYYFNHTSHVTELSLAK